jgi:cytochrome oxidase assembly protein ShyY1
MTFGHQTLLGLGVALFAVSAAIGVWLVRRRR